MASSRDFRDLLAQIVRLQAASGPLPSTQQSELMGQMMLNPYVEPSNVAPVAHADPRGPSVINRIFDLMSRPLYASANFVKGGIERGEEQLPEGSVGERLAATPGAAISALFNPEKLGDIWAGLSGREKTTGQDILETAGYDEALGGQRGAGVYKGIAGLTLDIGLDPLTYVGGIGLSKHLGRGVLKSIRALRGTEDAAAEANQALAQEVSRRAAIGAEETRTMPVSPGRTGPAPPIGSPPRVFQAGPGQPLRMPLREPLALPPGTKTNLPEPEKPTQVPSDNLADTIASPVVKGPETVSDLIEEVSGLGVNWRRMVQRQLGSIPKNADRLTTVRALEAQMATTRNPVFRNMIAQQIKKLNEGVTPASLIETARVNPPEFPKLSLSGTRRTAARELADSFLQANKYDEINHIGQTNLFNRVRNWIAKQRIPAKAKQSLTYQMLRAAEDRILEAGKKLVDAEGHSVRLSDVANLAGGSKALNNQLVDSFRKAAPMQAVEDVKAINAPVIAQQIIDPPVQAAKTITERIIQEGMPPSRTVEIGSQLTRELEALSRQAGASAVEASSARKFMRELFDETRDQLYNDVMKQARGLIRQSMTGKVDPILTSKISNKIYDALQANPKALGKLAEQSKVVEAIMMRFATAWNAKDLRPFARSYIDTARAVAAQFQKALTPLVRSTTPRQREQAWRVAQGRISAGTAEEQRLADQFRYLMERLVGAPDITDMRARAENVVTRAGLTLDDVNKELPKRFQFTNKGGSDNLGRQFDYKEGRWPHSWREWDVKEPAEALYTVTRAIQLATRKNAMLDDASARWATTVKGGDFSHTVDIPRLRGFYFPEPIARQLDTVWKRLESDKFHHGGRALQLFDKIQRMWKTGVTIYSPSHHIRNLNGDIFLGMLDGVTTVAPYRKAFQVMHAYKGRYKDIENVFNIMDTNLREAALQARPGKVLTRTKGGHNLTAEQIYQAAEGYGLLPRAQTLEDLIGPENIYGTFGPKFAPFKGRVHQTASKVTELRDHYARLAHFIDALTKSKDRNLRDAIEAAAQRVKKFHPDGSDLTGFEQSVMRRIIPFYSWLRKATPLVLEGAIMRPHITLLFPRAMANMQAVTGIETEGPADPFPMDQMFPDWIHEKGIGPIIPPDHPLAGIGRQDTWRGEAPGYVIVNPTNPFIDQVMQLGNPRQTAISSLTPAARIPIELLTGQTALGIPLSEVEGGTAGHLAQQIPPVGIGARITGMTRPDEPWHPEQLTNWLTTGGMVTGTGPYRSQAQFEIRELINEIGRRNRGQ